MRRLPTSLFIRHVAAYMREDLGASHSSHVSIIHRLGVDAKFMRNNDAHKEEEIVFMVPIPSVVECAEKAL